MDEEAYAEYFKEKTDKYESICRQCGICCGVDNDTCVNLEQKENGKYHCKVYDKRFGIQYRISGKIFHCIPIKQYIRNGFSDKACAYIP